MAPIIWTKAMLALQFQRGNYNTFDEAEIPANEDGRWWTRPSFSGTLYESL